MLKLEVLAGPMMGESFVLNRTTATVGRGEETDVCLVNDPRVSRYHCRLVRTADGLEIEDLGSTHGTYIGELRLDSKHVLFEGDAFRVGDTVLGIAIERRGRDEAPPANQATIPWMEQWRDDPRPRVTGTLDPKNVSDPIASHPPDYEIKLLRRRIEVMRQVADALGGRVDVPELLRLIAENVLAVLPADRIVIIPLDAAGHLQPPLVAAENPERRNDARISRAILDRCLNEKVAVIIEDALADELLRSRDSVMTSLSRSAMCVPLLQRNVVKALLFVDAPSARAFSPEDLALVTAVANQAAVALANAELFRNLQEAYETLQATQEKLIERERLSTLGTLSASIAHDVANVLQPIDAISARFLRDTSADAKSKEIFERQIGRLKALMQRLLSFSRNAPTNLSPIEVNDVVRQTLELMRTEARHRSIEFIEDLAPGLPRVSADPNRLDQVFLNLALNACDAMEPLGGGTLTVRSGLEGVEVVVRFEDTGTGIAPEVLSRIFESFYTTKGVRGTGLGLYGSRRIVEDEHGGLIQVHSELGKGATFVVRLPAIVEPDPTPNPRTSETARIPARDAGEIQRRMAEHEKKTEGSS